MFNCLFTFTSALFHSVRQFFVNQLLQLASFCIRQRILAEEVTTADVLCPFIKAKDIGHRDIIDNLRWCKAKHLTFQNMLNALFIIRNNGLQHLVAIQAFDYLRNIQA